MKKNHKWNGLSYVKSYYRISKHATMGSMSLDGAHINFEGMNNEERVERDRERCTYIALFKTINLS